MVSSVVDMLKRIYFTSYNGVEISSIKFPYCVKQKSNVASTSHNLKFKGSFRFN